MLSENLYENGISSLRYDKRGVGKSTIKDFNEREIEFGFGLLWTDQDSVLLSLSQEAGQPKQVKNYGKK